MKGFTEHILAYFGAELAAQEADGVALFRREVLFDVTLSLLASLAE